MRAPREGDYVTIVVRRSSGALAVAYVYDDPRAHETTPERPWLISTAALQDDTRGIEWALGTEGEEVEALKVANALC